MKTKQLPKSPLKTYKLIVVGDKKFIKADRVTALNFDSALAKARKLVNQYQLVSKETLRIESLEIQP